MTELLSHDQLQVLQGIDSVTSYELDIHERSDDCVLFYVLGLIIIWFN